MSSSGLQLDCFAQLFYSASIWQPWSAVARLSSLSKVAKREFFSKEDDDELRKRKRHSNKICEKGKEKRSEKKGPRSLLSFFESCI
jgi:hypothetical protein